LPEIEWKIETCNYENNLTFRDKRHMASVTGLKEKARTALGSIQLFDIYYFLKLLQASR